MTERTKPADTTEENDESGKDGAQQIVDFGSALTKTPHGSVYCMTIIGQIEGHNTAASGAKTTKYEHVLPLLAKLEESDEVNGVLFLLNTVGGDVEAGLAIAELIAGMTKPTVSIVLGGSHSIGVPLAVAARRSFAVPSAAMTIHPVRMSGTVIAAPQTYNYFQRLQDRSASLVGSEMCIRDRLLPAASGSDRGLRLQPQPDHGSEVPGPDAEKGRYGRRRWQCGLWRGGSVPGHHRPGGRPL